ncbi:unnamed protein product [Cuscuta europaea]|uniref:Uncharacterized protein n=1 Tax=Cuscuta europaea TaxID=41803 RepID=A0A9P0ZJT1_CUSEU|nr:unnamed protein product [Cuscuta europaea]
MAKISASRGLTAVSGKAIALRKILSEVCNTAPPQLLLSKKEASVFKVFLGCLLSPATLPPPVVAQVLCPLPAECTKHPHAASPPKKYFLKAMLSFCFGVALILHNQ